MKAFEKWFEVLSHYVLNLRLFQEGFDNDVDALLEEGLPVPKKMRLTEDRYVGDSDHQSDGEGGVQPMMTKIKTVLKSEWLICLTLGFDVLDKSMWFLCFG